MRITPRNRLYGKARLPGDKSISHRAAMLLAIADGAASISNFSPSADCASTLGCLERLGVRLVVTDDRIEIRALGKYGLIPPAEPLDCGNSGTTMRLLVGLLAGQSFESHLTGDASLRARPMGRIVRPLEQMGARIESEAARAPLSVYGRSPLIAAEIVPEAASAQIKSAVLLAGLYADGKTSVIEATPTRDHTERMLEWLGVRVETISTGDGATLLTVDGGARLTARDIVIPSDISAAAFFLVGAACLDGSDVMMADVGINGSRRSIIDTLISFGADIRIINRRELCNEPVADLVVRGGISSRSSALRVINGPSVAALIDEIPALAVFGTQVDGGLEVRGAGELRVKECDRISAIVENLRRMGADVIEFHDGFKVEKGKLRGARINPRGDHRIAMAFAIAGMFADGVTTIEGAECCAVSFPDFFDVVESLATRY